MRHAAACCLTFATALLSAQPEPWRHPDGTVHYYHALAVPGGVSWRSALDTSRTRGAYLATITSGAERDFVFGLVDSSRYWAVRPWTGRQIGPWLGGLRQAGSGSPDSGWSWVTGEAIGLNNWTTGAPDNRHGGEDALHFDESAGTRVWTWDDLSAAATEVPGYVAELSASATTVGLTCRDSAVTTGYFLFSSNNSRFTRLVDDKGRLVHEWRSDCRTAGPAFLLENGDLVHTSQLNHGPFAAFGGRVEVLSWDGSIVWELDYADSTHTQDHDVCVLPNGNIVMLAYELRTRDQAIAAGRNPELITEGELWPNYLDEVNPQNDSIVWEWHLWDHLVQDFDSRRANFGDVAAHSELVDVNAVANGGADWIHANTVDYHPGFDQLMITARNVGEVWVIDHSTTTEDARGHSGGRHGMGVDILYRWGNPAIHRAGDSSLNLLVGQHTAHWIRPGLPGAGDVLVFNNDPDRPGGWYSTVIEFTPPVDSSGRYPRPAPGIPHGPAEPCWSYRADPPQSFFSAIFGSAQRLSTGNTLICEGTTGRFFEVTPAGRVVWSYMNPVRDSIAQFQGDPVPYAQAYRVVHYPADFTGFSGRDMTPGYPLERYRVPHAAVSESRESPSAGRDPDREYDTATVTVAGPGVFRDQAVVRCQLTRAAGVRMHLFTPTGRFVRRLFSGPLPAGNHELIWDGRDDRGRPAAPGIYLIHVRGDGVGASARIARLEPGGDLR